MKMSSLIVLLLVLAGLPAPALAWSDYAHRLTARITLANLTPAARAEVRRILAKGASVDTPTCRLESLEDAATWPDCVRSLPDRFGFSAPWHYQNIDVCTPFDATANCPDGQCVTAQIPKQLAIVADRSASPAARAQALAFFVHFMGDMHMPLHIGDKHDKGGNAVPAAYGAKAPPWMNLHRIWDNELAERALTEPPAITPRSISAADRHAMMAGDIPDWTRESWELARTIVYPELKAYPDSCAVKPDARGLVDAAYVAAARDPLRLQVERAGVRTALLLNRALAR